LKKEKKSLKELIRWASRYLALRNVENSQVVAEILAEKITGKKRIDFYLEDISIDREKEEIFKKDIRSIGRKVPLAYIICEQEFMGDIFFLKPGVFIPRPETEILVERALDFLKEKNGFSSGKLRVVDVGTGCGNIAVSIAKRIENVIVYATDISSLSLEVAKKNARYHKVSDRVIFLLGSLFSSLDLSLKGKIDLIVSNPPYIEREKINSLPEEVKKEPRFALDGGKEGLDFYKKIVPESVRWLKSGGGLMLEVGYAQAEKVLSIIRKEDELVEEKIFRDLQGNKRVVFVKKK